MDAGPVLEQVPKYELHVVDDGVAERVELIVKLPGVSTAADIIVKCSSSSSNSNGSTGSISVAVPGRYNLQLLLPVNIPERAESVKYAKKKETLKVVCAVVPAPLSATGTAASNNVVRDTSVISNGNHSSNVADKPCTSASLPVLESFLPPPTKAERRRLQEAAALAAAAEAEDRRKEQEAAAAVAAAAAAAAEAEQRRQQQLRANQETAEAWLKRGLEAAQQRNIELASKALKKINDLGSGVDITPLRQALVQLRQQQQQQQQQQRQQQQQQQQQHSGQSSNSRSGSSFSQQQQQQEAGSQRYGTSGSNQQQQQRTSSGHPASGGSGSGWGSAGGRSGQPPSKGSSPPAADDFTETNFSSHAAAADGADGTAAGSSEGLVDWWCRHYDQLSEQLLNTAERLNDYAREPGRGVVSYWSAVAGSLLIVGLHFVIIWCWRMGWTQPLYVAAYIRQLGGDSYAESRVWIGTTAQYLMQHSLEAAGLRVCLVGLSGFTVWLLLWGMLLLRLGSHSLVGWCFAAAWGLAEALVWRPRHALQFPLAVILLMVFGIGGSAGAIAHWSLQMLLLGSSSRGGSWANVAAWALSWTLYLGLIPRIPPAHWAAANVASLTACVLIAHVFHFLFGGRWASSAGVKPAAVQPWSWGSWLLWLVEWGMFLGFVLLRVHFWGKMWGREEWTYSSHKSSDADQEADAGGFDPGHTKFVMGFSSLAVPEGCAVESVKSVLVAKNYYQVMGFTSREECTLESLKAARRKMALAVHPDKVGHDHPGANLAAGRVNKAYETLSSPEQRNAYDQLLDLHSQPRLQRQGSSMGRASSNGDHSNVPPFEDSLYDIDDNPMYLNDMPCGLCRRQHTVYLLPKAPWGVRWCGECSAWHDVGNTGEVWAHWSPSLGGLLGRARILFASDRDSPVYDITDMFKCAGKLAMNSMKACNTHHNPIADVMSTQAGGKGNRRGQRAQQQPQQHSSNKKKKGRRR